MKPTQAVLYSDASTRPSLGLAGIGWILLTADEKTVISYRSKVLVDYGTRTCCAEYCAAIAGVIAADGRRIRDIVVRSDSEVLVRQMTGIYTVRDVDLIALHAQLTELLTRFSSWDIVHVPREYNKHADMLAGRATQRLDGLRNYEKFLEHGLDWTNH